MTYQLPVYSNEDLAKATSYPPLECGRYRFKVIDRQEGTTKQGNHMENITLEVCHRGQGKKPMRCYHRFFIEKDTAKPGHMYDIKKIKDFLDCIGVEYTSGAFERVVNREGQANFLVATYVKEGTEREKFVIPDDGFTEDKKIFESKPSENKNGEADRFDDDIPF